MYNNTCKAVTILLNMAVSVECGMSPMHLGGSMGVFGTTLDNFTECSWKIQVPNKKVQ